MEFFSRYRACECGTIGTPSLALSGWERIGFVSRVNSPDRREARCPPYDEDAEPRPAFHKLPSNEGLKTLSRVVTHLGGWNDVEREQLANQLWQRVFTKSAEWPKRDWIRHPERANEEDSQSDEGYCGRRRPAQL